MDEQTARTESIFNIQCSIFGAQEERIQRLNTQINQARTVQTKAPLAEELSQAAQKLLDCEKYQEHSLDCAYCQQFSELRRKTAQLILAARRLAR
jgi:hypothetical protein